MRAPPNWSPGRIAEIRKCVASPPNMTNVDYREWSYRFGAVYTKRPLRNATCAECGGVVAAGSEAYFVVHTETRTGAWTPQQRYLHIACPSREYPASTGGRGER